MTSTPPGWYADPTPPPGHPPAQRWWDGQGWTEHLAPAAPATTGSTQDRTTADGEELAGWGRRLGAYLLDWVITTAASLVLSLPFLLTVFDYVADMVDEAIDAAEQGRAWQQPSQLEIYGDLLGPFVGTTLVSLAVYLVYHGVSLRLRGATPAKLWLGLRVRPVAGGDRLGYGVIARRLALVVAVSLLNWIPVLGFLLAVAVILDGLWPLWDKRRQALHDKLAGTQVVRVR